MAFDTLTTCYTVLVSLSVMHGYGTSHGKTGKKVSARQRKKLSQDVEPRRRDAAYERVEEAAHRSVLPSKC